MLLGFCLFYVCIIPPFHNTYVSGCISLHHRASISVCIFLINLILQYLSVFVSH